MLTAKTLFQRESKLMYIQSCIMMLSVIHSIISKSSSFSTDSGMNTINEE